MRNTVADVFRDICIPVILLAQFLPECFSYFRSVENGTDSHRKGFPLFTGGQFPTRIWDHRPHLFAGPNQQSELCRLWTKKSKYPELFLIPL